MTLAHPEGARVLVVDDDPLLVRLVRTHLEKAGYRVIEARDGEQALDVAATELPDLVVLDLMLPKLDGFEVCRRIREFSLVPVVMLTARGEPVDRVRGSPPPPRLRAGPGVHPPRRGGAGGSVAGLRDGCRRLPGQAVRAGRAP